MDVLCIVVFIFSFTVFTHGVPGKAPLVPLNDGHSMPTIALGTFLLNSSKGGKEPEGDETEKAVLWAFGAGYRHIDTSWVDQVEYQVGDAVNRVVHAYNLLHEVTTTQKVCDVACYINKYKKRLEKASNSKVPPVSREEIFITTKLWNDAHAPKAVVPALRRSLEELRLSYVDLYLMHWPLGQFANGTYDKTHYIATWRAMMAAQKLNLTRSIGVCNFHKGMLENIRKRNLTMPAVLQIEWNINLQQASLLAYCREHNISVMGYTPFGALMDKKRADAPTRIGDAQLAKMAAKYGKNVPQILLRYAVEMGVTPIPKSITTTRISQNIDIFDFNLNETDKITLQGFDRRFRTAPQAQWRDHTFYPFDRSNLTTTSTTSRSTRTQRYVLYKMNLDDLNSRIKFRDIV
ncbi:aldo-keto reductase AKR2E4-like [Leguminivora glycinivorella]|uniref:aldo-keto reductase AKR2E4-like n=1 Tax=Leguminivora glycinivorella TaxID=1035111 RepID=UPI00200ED5A0|nr:aldo-keto reductase AKR2E4-like [Leguminivora glycinivorella]